MNKEDKLIEIQTLANECNKLKIEMVNCHEELKNSFNIYKKKFFSKIKKKSDNTITDLKLLLSYLKKHNELKMMYSSYREILREMMKYKKKLIYFSHISKPLISKSHLEMLLKEQNNIIENVSKVNDMLPKIY